MNNCQVCGNPITRKTSFKPRSYCSDNCRDFNKYKNAFEDKLLKIKPTKESRKLLRGDMFRLSNSISIGTLTHEVENVF